MKINVIKPSAEILSTYGPDEIMKFLEKCGRTCYKSEGLITDDSADRFVEKICQKNHESVLEHVNITARFICSRACSHQLVRHRIAAYSQESQRYVNYKKKGYQVICPPGIGVEPGEYTAEWSHGDVLIFKNCSWVRDDLNWLATMARAFKEYEFLLDNCYPPEDARYVLPNACKTEIVATYNLRTWRHIFRERALNKHAQWEIKSLMTGLLHEMRVALPVIFGDL